MRYFSVPVPAVALLTLFLTTISTAAEPRLFDANDINALHEVSDPQLSPDAAWIAYTVRTADREKDKRRTHVWMTSWDGKRTVQLTSSTDSEDTPRWSPDGRYVSFLSARADEDSPDQLWLMDRGGGEA
jgi:Tol biopolymer transport system component